MDRLKLRGLKRKCQSEACALPFYDLNRAEFACPNCGAAFVDVPVVAATLRASGRSFGGPGSRMHVRARPEVEAVPEEAKLEDVVKDDDGFEDAADDAEGTGPILELEDEDDAPAIEPPQEETPEN